MPGSQLRSISGSVVAVVRADMIQLTDMSRPTLDSKLVNATRDTRCGQDGSGLTGSSRKSPDDIQRRRRVRYTPFCVMTFEAKMRLTTPVSGCSVVLHRSSYLRNTAEQCSLPRRLSSISRTSPAWGDVTTFEAGPNAC